MNVFDKKITLNQRGSGIFSFLLPMSASTIIPALIPKEHEFIAGGYYLECRNNKFSKKVQTFYDLKEYTISLVKELIYIDDIESDYLQNEIDYSTFKQK